MQFTKDSVPGIVDGTTTVTFRRWSRSQARVGGRYRTWGILLEVDDIRLVAAADISDDEARLAGADSASAVLDRLGASTAAPIWRVQFRCIGQDDRIERRNAAYLDDEHRAALQRRLDRMDRASKTGPWTATTLRLIATYPGIVSTTLARQLNVDRPAFKINVRKLKELGLTESLEIGYRLSPLGKALMAVNGRATGASAAVGVID